VISKPLMNYNIYIVRNSNGTNISAERKQIKQILMAQYKKKLKRNRHYDFLRQHLHVYV